MNPQAAAHAKGLGPLGFFAWSLVIGVVAALGAVIFRALIAFFHNLFFLGQFSLVYDASSHTPPGPWGTLIILMPVLGAAGVAFLVGKFAEEAKGHGVPEVIDAIYYNKGVIRPAVALIKSLASALSIGSGGSVGREGPIAQIGSSFGSTLGQLLGLPTWQTITMIAAGAGAGISATFNTPIGGVLFAVEIMLHEVSARTLIPVTIATVTSASIGRFVFGNYPAFVIPLLDMRATHSTDLFFYVGLGLLMGLVSIVYIRSIYSFEDFFEQRVSGNCCTRHMLGMLGVGIIMYGLMQTKGHYFIEGVGYATIQDVLDSRENVFWFLLLLFVLKLLATCLTLGSGGSGGIFSPALFLGATLGGAYGMAVRQLFPGLEINIAAFAVAGMAGMVAGSTGAALAAIVMIFEMTLDYAVVIPMTITVALSYGVRKVLFAHSIYTLKLARRGHGIPDALQANFHYLKKTGEVMDTRIATIQADATFQELANLVSERPEASCFLVEGPTGIIGFLTRDTAQCPSRKIEATTTVAELSDRRFVGVGEDSPLVALMMRMRSAGAVVAIVTEGTSIPSNGKIRGVITKDQIANTIIDGMEMFSAPP